jgi:hypothetical protein
VVAFGTTVPNRPWIIMLFGCVRCLDYRIKDLLLYYQIGAGVAQSVQWLTTDRTAGVRSPTGTEDLSSSLCVQTGSGAHPASCTMGTGGHFLGSKERPGREADHSPPYSAEVKYE